MSERRDSDWHEPADRLDAYWDALVQTGSGDISAATDGDAARASLVAYIDLLTPKADATTRERIRQRIFASIEETPMPTVTIPLATPTMNGHRAQTHVPRIQAGRSGSGRWWHRPLGALQLATTFALVVATIGGILLLRPNDDLPSLPAANSPEFANGTPESGSGAQSLLNLQLDGPNDTALSVTISRVTLPPGTRWDFDVADFPKVTSPIDQYVESGTLAVSVAGQEHLVKAGGNFGVDGGPDYIRNSQPDPVVMLLAVAHLSDESPPTPPAAITVESIGTAPLPTFSDDMRPLVTLSQGSFSGTGAPAVPVYPKQQTVFVAVESGTMIARTAPEAMVLRGRFGTNAGVFLQTSEFTSGPEDGTQLESGDTLTVDPGNGITETVIVGDDPVETLFLNMEILSAAAVAAQSPMSVSWDIAAGDGRVGFMLYRLTLAPDAYWGHRFAGVIAYQVVDGSVRIAGETDDFTEFGPGESVSFTGSGRSEVRTGGSEPAVVVVGIVYSEVEGAGTTRNNVGSGVAITLLGEGSTTLPPGLATVGLFPEAVPTGTGSSSSSYPGNGARLIGILSGSLDVTRLAGQVEIAREVFGAGAAAGARVEFPIGEPTTVLFGDAIVAQPRSGYGFATNENDTPELMVLTVTSEAPLDVSIAGPRGDEAMTVDAAACGIAPRSTADLQAILADPSAGEPDPGLRDQAETGVPADATTTAAVSATVRDVVACNRSGARTRIYALMSENAIRSAAAAGAFSIEEMEGGVAGFATPAADWNAPDPVFAIDDIVTFPDGRAGAIVNANGEIAYLTFIFDPGSGRWLIDAWDDREPGEAATPAA